MRRVFAFDRRDSLNLCGRLRPIEDRRGDDVGPSDLFGSNEGPRRGGRGWLRTPTSLRSSERVAATEELVWSRL